VPRTAFRFFKEYELEKRQLGPCVTFFPQPATLICTTDEQHKINLMMASWVGIVSKTPPTIAVSLHHDRKTYANILASRVFSINLVTPGLAVAADACGLVSGNRVDKHDLTGLDVVPGSVAGVFLVNDSPLNVECQYQREVELGDYRLVMGEIIEIHACEDAFDTGKADVKAFDPLVYLGGLREYWSLGSKQADAYSAGSVLLKK
jgi:flavin reductase (DIM6/NTAB) family NADH-FMN oxidoreductase RutF